MVNILEIKNSNLTEKIEAHEKIGGALRISVFEIKENHLGQLPDEYDAHLITARQTLEKQNFEWNFHFNKVAYKNKRKSIAYAQTDFDKLDPSGQKINLLHFLGPHFDLNKIKPFIRGQLGNDTLNSYFHYAKSELPENKIDITAIDAIYRKLYQGNEGYFIHALMEPPYGLSLGKEIYLRGKYLLEFLEYFFSDLNELTIYAWDTNCSLIFDAGKEWWGSYFWTVFNPTKKWYIGIIASETD
ncbi:hypothetical protein HIO71_16125 [Chryseobacterium aquaticum]|uniref:Uncharacterized protein n=1 Tax=Chryseobacterium aquaticum TaxID=452084 RepID=A0A848N5P5_9FLAO|nr:hypothetical protein [Chryseobacterium sp. C-204]NMR35706.1 hypothetical protein [Chryseobacterium aquaticum]